MLCLEQIFIIIVEPLPQQIEDVLTMQPPAYVQHSPACMCWTGKKQDAMSLRQQNCLDAIQTLENMTYYLGLSDLETDCVVMNRRIATQLDYHYVECRNKYIYLSKMQWIEMFPGSKLCSDGPWWLKGAAVFTFALMMLL